MEGQWWQPKCPMAGGESFSAIAPGDISFSTRWEKPKRQFVTSGETRVAEIRYEVKPMYSPEWQSAENEIREIVDAIPMNHPNAYVLCLRVMALRLIDLGRELDGFEPKFSTNQDKASNEVTYFQFTSLFSAYVQVATILHADGQLPASLNHRFESPFQA
jgi:hypothetical protein